jgi:hypothetical protein
VGILTGERDVPTALAEGTRPSTVSSVSAGRIGQQLADQFAFLKVEGSKPGQQN